MVALNTQPLSWTDFTAQYVPSAVDNDAISQKKLKIGLRKYTHSLPELQLNPETRRMLRNYAFTKVEGPYNRDVALTQKSASEVFEHYQKAMCTAKMQVSLPEGLTKDKGRIPKPIRWFAKRFSFISSSLYIKFVEPTLKKRIQALLNQVEAANQTTTSALSANASPITDRNGVAVDFKNVLSLEILAKKMAYLNPEDGEIFQIVYNGRTIDYKVEVLHLRGNLNAMGFVPVDENEDAPPLLVYSGTRLSVANPGTLDTLVEDFRWSGVGIGAWEAGRKNIRKWMEKVGGDVVVTGHSLGGALARYTAIEYPDLIKDAVTFSSPGIGRKYVKKWKKMVAAGGELPSITNYNNSEDKVPGLGHGSVGINMQVICKVEKTVGQKISAQRLIHRKMLMCQRIAVVCETEAKKTMPIWKQRALTIIPFIILITLTSINRVLFGTTRSYAAVFGPLRWLWHQTVQKTPLPDLMSAAA